MDYLLDSYPAPDGRHIRAWVKRDCRPERVDVRFEAPFTLAARQGTLADAEGWLGACKDVERVWKGRSRLDLNGALHPVLRVLTRRYQDMPRVATQLRRHFGVQAFHVFDVDHPVESRWMRRHGIYPFCQLQAGTLQPLEGEDRFGLDYAWPDLRTLRVHAEADAAGAIASLQANGEELHDGSESDAILRLCHVLRERDPDVLLTQHGHTGTIPLLLERIRATGLQAKVRLGRDMDPRRPAQPEQSFSTYGQVVYRAATWDLRGRLHIDLRTKYLKNSSDREDLHGLVYLARIGNRGAQQVSTHSPGYVIQQIHIDRAQQAAVAVPWKRNLVEGWKTLDVLAAVDRGGQVHVPLPGIHDDVWEMDFSAYYPSLIVELRDYVEFLAKTPVFHGPETPVMIGPRGEVVSYMWFWRKLKQCAAMAGLDKPVATHTARKSAGKRMGLVNEHLAAQQLGITIEVFRKHYGQPDVDDRLRARHLLPGALPDE